MNGLDLFSGIGGLALALDGLVRPIAYCENDRFAQAVLLSRMFDRRIGLAPIWDDVRTLRGEDLPNIDIIYGGFPCQDISSAGTGRGLAGERSGLYLEIERLVRETKPTFVFLENVPAIRTRGLGRVVWGLSELGYDCRWTIVSAAEVGAPHLRKRWFLLAKVRDAARLQRSSFERNESNRNHERPKNVAYTYGEGELCKSEFESRERTSHSGQYVSDAQSLGHSGRGGGLSGSPNEIGPGCDAGGLCEALADTTSARREPGVLEISAGGTDGRPPFMRRSWWEFEPELGRVAHGVSHRVDRLRGLGNAVVPLQAKVAFMRLMGLEAS